VLAATTSADDTGLLRVLVSRFESATEFHVTKVVVGTGVALGLGARGEADVVLVHSRHAEEPGVGDGNGTERLLVMHNDFVLVGPVTDPAGIAGKRPRAAFRAIASNGSPWVSRDDHSGTDLFEKQLWEEAGVNPRTQTGYLTSGLGMSDTLTFADDEDAYTITDRATYLTRQSSIDLQILVQDDVRLINVYHVITVNPSRFTDKRINSVGAAAFAHFLVSPEIQELIGDYGREQYGRPLFVADAGKSEAELLDRPDSQLLY